ncbi:DUF5058 family protein [Alkaliphilus serpentinus]|uniref:DUF5058 family protein n=1 Tax=Alkaliphilus serpentinus TaxID=1482731 RepID=A0A833HPF3_9FIRM|nr:DUF5058 family protein [Alkaliphilus serpentinus]KAB3530690.1 DUF5058 family protein [Alkaliphilus serpentinus]
MKFNLNSNFLFMIGGCVFTFVIAQSVFFLYRAIKQAKIMGMDRAVIKSTIISSAAFSIAPALSILLGVLSLSKFLGLPLPWIRLSILGALTYELTAAASAASSVGISVTEQITNPQAYTTIAWVMTLGIIPGVILIPLFLKKIQGGLISQKNRDRIWGEHFMTAIFLGMISAFLGMVFATVRKGIAGWIPVFVLIFSAIVMVCCGLAIKKYNVKWLEDYALPFSILGGMAFAILTTHILV